MHDLLIAKIIERLEPAARQQLDRSAEQREQLAAALEQAAHSWPELRVADDALAAYIAARLPLAEAGSRAWRAFCDAAEDLVLCCACTLGDDRAVAAFHQRYLPLLRSTLVHLRLAEPLVDEVQQRLIEQLLVGGTDRPPLLGNFAGAGRLSAWLRVVTSRNARRALQREKKLVPMDDRRLADGLIAAAVDGQLARAKVRYREAFGKAFRRAMKELMPRDATLLRHRYVDELSLEQVGAIYRVHHSTALRWIDKIRRALLARTHELLAEELGVSQRQCSSIIRLIQSDLAVSIRTFFGKQAAE